MKILKFTSRLFPSWISEISADIPDPRIPSRCLYSMEQVFFSGLLVFLLRYRSLHSFCQEHRGNSFSIKNLWRYLSINDIPSDDEFRNCLQTVPTKDLNQLLKSFHARLERGKVLSKQKLFKKFDLVSLDGTGQLGSVHIQCESCQKKRTF